MIRITRSFIVVVTAFLVLMTVTACVQTTSAPVMPGSETQAERSRRPLGYLGDGAPKARDFLPPPPAADSVEGLTEMRIFHDTRALEGSARWDLAASDAAGGAEHMWSAFSCALDAEIESSAVPKTAHLIQRIMADVGPIIGEQKNFYGKPRPYTVATGNTCVPAQNLSSSGAYPSGHATVGWTWALILAQLVPERAGPVIGRGRAYGESRVACGVHYPSDVVGGQTVATAVIAALQSNAEFIADRDAAKAELDHVRTTAAKPDSTRCEIEVELLGSKPW